jgi:hypothetical protein
MSGSIAALSTPHDPGLLFLPRRGVRLLLAELALLHELGETVGNQAHAAPLRFLRTRPMLR